MCVNFTLKLELFCGGMCVNFTLKLELFCGGMCVNFTLKLELFCGGMCVNFTLKLELFCGGICVNFTLKLSNLLPAKCIQAPKLAESREKIMTRVHGFLWVSVFHFPPTYKKIFSPSPDGEGVLLENVHHPLFNWHQATGKIIPKIWRKKYFKIQFFLKITINI